MKRKSSKSTSYRLTPEAKRLLVKVSEKLGVTQSAIIEMAIRKMATTEGVK